MSFFGGGTDMEDYFRENGGAVLSTTFDKYCYVNVRHLPRFFDYTSELAYSKTERVTDVNDIQHPAIREAMKMLDMQEIRLTYEADLPARSGLGTSSSFAVGMLNAFYALKGKYADKKKLADEAIYLERVLCKEAGGWQDQIAASFGGFNRINFGPDGYEVLPIIISPERKRQLNNNLLMFFTGFTRFSSDVQKANSATATGDKKARLKKMYALVDEAEAVLTDKTRSLDDFGRLLDVTWKLKKGTGGAVSTGSIDELYEKGIAAGALGGKLLGAGGGLHTVLYGDSDRFAPQAEHRGLCGLCCCCRRAACLHGSDRDGDRLRTDCGNRNCKASCGARGNRGQGDGIRKNVLAKERPWFVLSVQAEAGPEQGLF